MSTELLPIRQRKCIALAKDVLLQLKFKRLNLRCGSYCYRGSNFNLIGYNLHESAQVYIPAIQKECSVCALGSMMLSHVTLYNKVITREINNFYNREFIEKRLNTYFSKTQLNLIECAFEGYPCPFEYPSILEREKAVNFGRKYDDLSTRLRAIMQNIVRNKGFFVPK